MASNDTTIPGDDAKSSPTCKVVGSAAAPGKRIRDRARTRQAILDAASTLFAGGGYRAITMSAVAQSARVNRGTIYQHFPSCDALAGETVRHVSDKMFVAVFGRDGEHRDVETVDIADTMHRLIAFAMENAELGRSWLLRMLASENPSADPFWREYEGSLRRFAMTARARDDIDTEAMAILILSGIFLWPVWVQSHAKTNEQRRRLALRMSREILRLSMFGSMRPEHFPELAERLSRPTPADDAIELAFGR